MASTGSAKQAPAYDLPTPEPDSPALTRSRQPYRFSTLCATVDSPDGDHKDQHGSSSVPIYQTATFKGVGNQYDYTRSGNPTRTHLGKFSTLLCAKMHERCAHPAFVQGGIDMASDALKILQGFEPHYLPALYSDLA